MIRLSFAVVAIVAPIAAASGLRAHADDVLVETLLTGLSNPCGVAARPGASTDRHEIFVADSGAGRVMQLWSDQPNTASIAVAKFSLAKLGEGGLPVGPLGLHFLDRHHLVVGCSGNDGARVLLFELPEQPAQVSIDQAIQQIASPSGDKERQHIYAFARTRPNPTVPDVLVFATFSNDQSGLLGRIAVRGSTLGEIQLLSASQGVADFGSPAAITVDTGGHVVVGWVGRVEQPHDSRLAFHRPTDTALRMAIATELNDILGLAFSPKTGNLYAVDHAPLDGSAGGVYRIDDASEPGEPQCTVVKIADVRRPSSLAFGPDGALYVTAFGDISTTTQGQGVLIRIKGDL